jgi:flagellar biosynthesis GTPase FlhF
MSSSHPLEDFNMVDQAAQNEQEAAAQHQALQQQQIQQQQAAAQAAQQATQQQTQHQIAQQAAQMTQQMLTQQQQQQQPVAMPIVALPDWNGKDVEGHLDLLDATLQANGQLGILNEPLRYSALLFTSCKNERKATEFIHFHMR